MKGCYVQNFATFCRCFEKHSTEKNKENIHVGTVYNLFDHLNMALSSGFRHLKTLLAARSVFHLFWRWQPVARAPFQQPQNAAVLKHSRPRASDTAIRVSLIVARPYFLALLSGACHLVSCLTWCLIFRGKKKQNFAGFAGANSRKNRPIFAGFSREKSQNSWNNRPISWEKSQNSQKNRPISRDFSGKKSNFEGFSGANS